MVVCIVSMNNDESRSDRNHLAILLMVVELIYTHKFLIQKFRL